MKNLNKTIIKQSEFDLQCQIVSTLKLNKIFCIAVPNGVNQFGKIKNPIIRNKVIAKHKRSGLKYGAADLICILKNRVVFLEIKTILGKQSNNQKEFEKIIKALGYEYYLVRELEELNNIFNLEYLVN